MNRSQQLFLDIKREFSRNKTRTLLTSLGITIGVFAVVMLLALGVGVKNYIGQQFQNLGANVIAIVPGQGFSGGFSGLIGSIRFTEQNIRDVSRISELDYVAPAFISNVPLTYQDTETITPIIGTNPDFFQLFNLNIIAGEALNESHVSRSQKVGILGETKARELFGDPQNAIGEVVKTNDLRITIIGVVGTVGNPQRDNALTLPYTTTFLSLNPKKEFFAIYTGVSDESLVESAKTEIERTLGKKYDDDEFSAVEPTELLASIDQIFQMINIVIVSIGSISLLVGGIGIMNIMYSNITERTKEIGIRRSIGATKSDILLQFLIESVILSLLGGMAGLALAVAVVLISQRFFPAEITSFSVLLSVGVSSFVGIFFGVFPARRAANLSPMDAIRK